MNIATKIAIAALAGLGIAAIDAQAQGTPGGGPGGEPGPMADVAPLSPDQIKTVIDGRLVLKRSDLKVGKVTDKDGNTYEVELVKPDGTVAEHATVDKRFARPSGALAGMGPGMMGPGGMGPGGMGPHGKFMHGRGDGPRCGYDDDRGPGQRMGMFGGQRETPLTAVQVKDIIEGRIAMRGENYTVGKVAEKDADTWQAEVLGAGGKVEHSVLVDKQSGRFRLVR